MTVLQEQQDSDSAQHSLVSDGTAKGYPPPINLATGSAGAAASAWPWRPVPFLGKQSEDGFVAALEEQVNVGLGYSRREAGTPRRRSGR